MARWSLLLVCLAVEAVALAALAWRTPLEGLPLYAGYSLAFGAWLGVLALLERPLASVPFWVVAALLLRLPWLGGELSLSDDAWRYLHDGRAQLAGVSPYAHAPAAPEAAAYAGPEHQRINHPELPTIYPPAAQLLFRSAIALGGTLLAWKLVLLVFDIGIGLALAGLLRARGLPASRAAIYLVHPLPIIEFAGNGHVDAVALCLLVAALALASRRPVASGAAVAGSVAAKYLALPLLPFLARSAPRRMRLMVGALAALAALYMPFFGDPVFGSLSTFARSWDFNGSLFPLLAASVGPVPARWVAGAALAGVLVTLWRARTDAPTAAFVWIAAALLLSPVVHPWYVTWLVPFLAWRREPWALVWSGTVVAAYAVLPAWRSAGIWDLPLWARVAQYVPVYTLIVLGLLRLRQRQRLRAVPPLDSQPS